MNSADAAVSDTLACIADDSGGLQVVDIRVPESPEIVGSVETPSRAYGVAIAGTHAFVTSGSNGLYVIDISVPEYPEIVGSVTTPGWATEVVVSSPMFFSTVSSPPIGWPTRSASPR